MSNNGTTKLRGPDPDTTQQHGGSVLEPGTVIAIYVCPNCGSYYGSSNMGDLENLENRPPRQAEYNKNLKQDEGTKRSQCFNAECLKSGIQRVRCYAKLIPTDDVAEARTAVKAAIKAGRSPDSVILK